MPNQRNVLFQGMAKLVDLVF